MGPFADPSCFQSDGISSPEPQAPRAPHGSCEWRCTPQSLSLSSAVGLHSLNIESRHAFGFHSAAAAAKVSAGISAVLWEVAFRTQGHSLFATVCAFLLSHSIKESLNDPSTPGMCGGADEDKSCSGCLRLRMKLHSPASLNAVP